MQTLYNVQPSENQTYKMLPFCCGGLSVRIILNLFLVLVAVVVAVDVLAAAVAVAVAVAVVVVVG